MSLTGHDACCWRSAVRPLQAAVVKSCRQRHMRGPHHFFMFSCRPCAARPLPKLGFPSARARTQHEITTL